ncbi:MAG: NAD(P)/FAD-dependent oxidoreductase [Pseudomonadota bacterium]
MSSQRPEPRPIGDTREITIVGAGLAGSLAAVYLAQLGFRVEVFERWSDPRRDDVPAGRSINLALAERGIHALAGVGLHHRVARFALPMRGRMVHDARGVNLQPYGQSDDEVIYSVHRARLNCALLDAAEATKRVRIHFSQELVDLDLDSGQATFHDHASDRRYARPVLPIIGADGVGSPVRAAIERHGDFKSDIRFLDHSYRELTIPPTPDGGFRMAPEALHVWPRGGHMMIALPNEDRSFTATLFMPSEGDRSFAETATYDDFVAFVQAEFPDAVPHLTQLPEDFEEHPVGVLGTIRCPRWHIDGRAVLIGDAAHAIVPFHGQGMNCGFEDCEALARIIGAHRRWEDAFADFEADRKPNANAIADMALENYIEMRSSVSDDRYLLMRTLALELERRHPERFVPRYALVMFRRIPYAAAQKRGEVNRAILRQLTRDAGSLDDIDFEAASRLVEDRLTVLERVGQSVLG